MISTGQVLQGTVPFWGVEKSVWLRITELRAPIAHIRLTPADPPHAITTTWVHLSDITFAIAAGLLEPVPASVTCQSCDGSMRLVPAVIKKVRVMAWTCCECESVIVI
jgi:hypothetical protein